VVHQDTANEVKSTEPSDTFVHVFTTLGEYHIKRAPYSADGTIMVDETAKVRMHALQNILESHLLTLSVNFIFSPSLTN
jgi:hypothetical protein